MGERHLPWFHGPRASVVLVAVAATLVPPAVLRGDPAESSAARVAAARHHESRTEVVVKFRDGAAVNPQPDVLSQFEADFPRLRVQRLFTTPLDRLARERSRIERSSRRQLADLSKYFRIAAPDAATADELLAQLSSSSLVETAYRAPLPAPPPSTPDFVDQQGYRNGAPEGVGASSVASVPGATGSAVKIIDVEYSWNQQHEDLSKARNALIPNGTAVDPFSNPEHGTAVLGELVADANGFGVTGIVPDASLGLVNAFNAERSYDLANSIDLAHHQLGPGDVIVVEQQAVGVCGGCYVPVEWYSDVYDAIVSATADGVLVVEAAGNGGQNLDDAVYGSPFPGGRARSGAFIVGASDACITPRARVGFSDYGSRVDFQGWGGCVVTTGYGSLYGQDADTRYTASFNGTSSATPIVAGAIAVFSSAYRTRFGTSPAPELVRSVLTSTGTPQNLGSGTLGGNIGPQPDLVAALAAGLSRPANDSFAGAQVLSGAAGTVTGSTVGATKEPGEPAHGGNPGGASVWYQWTAPANGTLTVDTFTSGFDTLLEAYTGSAIASLTPVVANDDDNGTLQSRAGPFTVTAGTTYLIAVDGYSGQAGALALRWRYVATAPPVAALPGRLVP